MQHVTLAPTLCSTLLAAALAVACGEGAVGPSAGAIRVVVTTTGTAPDPDGYSLSVDGGTPQRIAVTATTLLTGIAEGTHVVSLADVAAGCVAGSALERSVGVAPDATSELTFDLTCDGAGTLRLVTATTGVDFDADGYVATVDGGPSHALQANGTLELRPVAAGEHSVALSGLEPNCSAAKANPHRVTVPKDGTVELRIEIACAPAAGTLRVFVVTTGPNPDPDGYQVRLDATAPIGLGPGGFTDLRGIRPGEHTLEVSGVAGNCRIEPPQPIHVTIVNGRTTEARLTVLCAGSGRLLFSSDRSGPTHLYVMNADGSVTDLTPTSEAQGGDWSPDGSAIAFTTERDGAPAIYLMNVDGSSQRRLAAGAQPVWSPDGKTIAFVSSGAIKVMSADGSDSRVLTAGAHPSWSPDGTTIAFDRVDRSRCVANIFCARNIHTIGADGAHERKLTNSGASLTFSGNPAWSPDGTLIAFRAGDFLAPGRILLISPSGAAERAIAGGGGPGGPVWAPDGSSIAFALSMPDGTTEIRDAPLDGTVAVTLVSGPGTEIPWSRR